MQYALILHARPQGIEHDFFKSLCLKH
jgi:hypothetical protein